MGRHAAVGKHPASQNTLDFLVRASPEAGFLIRRQVGRDVCAELRVVACTTGQILVELRSLRSRHLMAADAPRRHDDVAAALGDHALGRILYVLNARWRITHLLRIRFWRYM